MDPRLSTLAGTYAGSDREKESQFYSEVQDFLNLDVIWNIPGVSDFLAPVSHKLGTATHMGFEHAGKLVNIVELGSKNGRAYEGQAFTWFSFWRIADELQFEGLLDMPDCMTLTGFKIWVVSEDDPRRIVVPVFGESINV